MERIPAADARIVDLATRLCPPRPIDVQPASKPSPDPEAMLELERIKVLEAARAEGLAQGLQQADDEIAARVAAAEREVEEAHSAESRRLRAASEQLTALLTALPDSATRADARLEDIAIEATYAAVLRLLGEVRVDEELIASVCRQALSEYRQRPVTIRASNDDAVVLAELADGDAIRVVADARLAAGQCQLETHKGLYDTGLEVRLDALKQAFLRSLGSRGASP